MKRFYPIMLLPLLCLISCGSGNNPDWKEQYKIGTYCVIKFMEGPVVSSLSVAIPSCRLIQYKTGT